MITFTPLADSDHQHFAKDLFESAFPEEERPPFGRLKKRNNSRFHFLVATTEDDDEPIGILSYWRFDDFTYVEHFAIAEELRNQGLGKAVFLNFVSQQTQQIVMEVEPSHDEMSDHRIEFYASMGFVQNPQPYEQPSYHGDSRRIPMIIMSKLPLDDDEFEEVKRQIYSEVYLVAD
ncbi:MAG: GNAT family N-acetyltransferase [Bacteroidales bacterium]|nr:GNAT family N-acetyltransferase [Bacteroidales bacterium]